MEYIESCVLVCYKAAEYIGSSYGRTDLMYTKKGGTQGTLRKKRIKNQERD